MTRFTPDLRPTITIRNADNDVATFSREEQPAGVSKRHAELCESLLLIAEAIVIIAALWQYGMGLRHLMVVWGII